MTKIEIFSYILSFDYSSLNTRLDKLLREGRITPGARYYVYNPYGYYWARVSDIASKASNSKDYFRYIKRIDSTTWRIIYQGFQEDMEKIKAFIEEQEKLPFEKTQKQLLNIPI